MIPRWNDIPNPVIESGKVYVGSVFAGVAAGQYLEQDIGFLIGFTIIGYPLLVIIFIMFSKMRGEYRSRSDNRGEIEPQKDTSRRIRKFRRSQPSFRYKKQNSWEK